MQRFTTPQSQYQAYLLRLWRESPQGPWRIVLQQANGNQRFLFADLESLFAHLQRSIAAAADSPPDEMTG